MSDYWYCDSRPGCDDAIQERDELQALVKSIQDALGTEECGEALVEVARNAHRAEQKLAAIERVRA